MHWLQTFDIGLFRFVNETLANPVFDRVMPLVSGNAFFFPILILLGVGLIWKGRMRGVVCVSLLLLILPMGDQWVCRTIKRAVGRPRPFAALPDVRQPAARRGSQAPPTPTPKQSTLALAPAPRGDSMPSSHAANWFAATMVAFVYYRRSAWFMLPVALLVSFSRVYNGVHYPSDVLAGAILGAGYAAASLWCLEALWQKAGRKWFPLWWDQLPFLLDPSRRLADGTTEEFTPLPTTKEWGEGQGEGLRKNVRASKTSPSPRPSPRSSLAGRGSRERGDPRLESEDRAATPDPQGDLDAHWLRLGYILIALLLLARLVYVAGNINELTPDEAYQWLRSKHLPLPGYGEPPLFAYAQLFGTALFGNTPFGIRCLSPLCAAALSLFLLRFFARELNARAGFCLLLILTATPLLSAGAVLGTGDAFSVLLWTAAMVAGWRAIQPGSPTGSWAWVGLWMGLGFLSGYVGLLQWLGWATFLILWPAARTQLRRPGPYIAFVINLLCALPAVIWNFSHGWASFRSLASDQRLGGTWLPAFDSFFGLLDGEALLLNPIFLIGIVWASVAFWRRSRSNPRLVYFFSMGAPLFLVGLLFGLRSRILPNWIAPSVPPLLCLLVGYWDPLWRLGVKSTRAALIAGLAIGLPVVIIGHDTQLVDRLIRHPLPISRDLLRGSRGWKEGARLVETARQELLANGRPVFIITGDYRLAAELSFYLPGLKTADGSETAAVYGEPSGGPFDSFSFQPGYRERKKENAIFLVELSRDDPKPGPPPTRIRDAFDSVEDLGVRPVLDHGRLLRTLQLFGCRGLR